MSNITNSITILHQVIKKMIIPIAVKPDDTTTAPSIDLTAPKTKTKMKKKKKGSSEENQSQCYLR